METTPCVASCYYCNSLLPPLSALLEEQLCQTPKGRWAAGYPIGTHGFTEPSPVSAEKPPERGAGAAQPRPCSSRGPQPRSSPLPAGPPRGRRRDTSRPFASLLGTGAPRPPARPYPSAAARPAGTTRPQGDANCQGGPAPQRAASQPDWLPRGDWQLPVPSAGRHVVCGAGSGRCGAVSSAGPGVPARL